MGVLADRECEPDRGANPVPHPINSYALVTYIPKPLGVFLDWIRRDLEPKSLAPRSHLTLLPPRPLTAGSTVDKARSQLEHDLRFTRPLAVELGKIAVFPKTNVVYVTVEAGFGSLHDIYRFLNRGVLDYKEQYPYHPHVTLAQGLTEGEAEVIARAATMRWKVFRGPNGIPVQSLIFVQNNSVNRWKDLARYRLR